MFVGWWEHGCHEWFYSRRDRRDNRLQKEQRVIMNEVDGKKIKKRSMQEVRKLTNDRSGCKKITAMSVDVPVGRQTCREKEQRFRVGS
jgi:hypothetical protein